MEVLTLLKEDAEALDGDGLHVVGGVVELLEDGLADAAFLVRRREGGRDGWRGGQVGECRWQGKIMKAVYHVFHAMHGGRKQRQDHATAERAQIGLKRRRAGGQEQDKGKRTMFASSLTSLDSSVHRSLVAMNRASWRGLGKKGRVRRCRGSFVSCGAGDDPSLSLLAYLVRVRGLLQQDVERGLAHGCGTVGVWKGVDGVVSVLVWWAAGGQRPGSKEELES